MRPVFLFPSVTIIECAAQHVSAAIWSRRRGQVHCLRQTLYAFAERPATEAAWLASTVATLRALALPPGPVTLVLPAERTLTKMLTLPPAAPQARAQIIRFELSQSVPVPIEDLVWADLPTDATAGAGGLTVVIAAKRTLVDTLCAAADEAGLDVDAVWPASVAAVAAFRQGVPTAQLPALLVVPTGAATVLAQLDARCWALRVAVAVDGDAKTLAREVARTRENFASLPGLVPATRIYCHGEATAGACEGCGLPVERWREPAVSVGTNAGELSPIMVGAAVLALTNMQNAVDLLPGERRLIRRRRQFAPWCVAAAVLVIAAWVPPLRDAHRQLGDIEQRTRAFDQELAVTRARAARIQESAVLLAAAQRELAAWHELAAQRTQWVRLLADWQERLAGSGDAWLEKIRWLPAEAGGASQLAVTGCLVDRENPAGKGGAGVVGRVQRLRASWVASPWTGTMVAERYDTTQPGRLRFEWVFTSQLGGPP